MFAGFDDLGMCAIEHTEDARNATLLLPLCIFDWAPGPFGR